MLRQKEKRVLRVMRPLPRPVYQPEEGPRFDVDNAWDIHASVQPLNGQMYAALYGERVKRMLAVFAPAEVELEEGMGVALEGTGMLYRVAGPPEKWPSYQRAVLEKIE